MNYITTHQSFTLIGIQTRIQDPEHATDIIDAVWENFLAQNMIALIPNSINSKELYAVRFDYDGGGGFTYLLGTAVHNNTTAPLKMKKLTIPEAKYTVLTQQGPLAHIVQDMWQAVESSKIKRNFTFDIEVYKDIKNSKKSTVELYISSQ